MTGTIHSVLEELLRTAKDEKDKGDRFERLVGAYLRTDPVWADRFSDVWLWMQWPDRHGKPDTGIDLVARERETGDLTAVQCKFFSPDHTLQKQDIDSFFTASGKEPFRSRLIVSTTDNWSRHAEDALKDQQIPVTRLRFQDLDESSVDWSQFSITAPEDLRLKGPKELRPHQVDALWAVREGFGHADRGKLIMACGTGKTLTSLRIAEDRVPVGGRVLFLVPSISLLSQTLREWTADAKSPLRPFVVCSDTTVGRGNEDISPIDLAYPSTTNATKLAARLSQAVPDKLTVVFSTYQSLPVVAQAQLLGSPAFDLVVCDEAHRTTGVTLVDEDESNFVRVHDANYLKATKRLYMTATPRIYDDTSRSQAEQGGAVLASMDDVETFGPEFHRLGFGAAVEAGLLSDYKVLVLAVDEEAVSRTFQQQLADKNNELKLDDAAKIVGCWNGLAKRGIAEHDFTNDPNPMTRAVAFSRSIKDSEKFAAMFTSIVDLYLDVTDVDDEEGSHDLACQVQHVDGTFNVLKRNERLDWLKATTDADTCRVLTNVRCLSEGVDVPALDAVLFLNPRNSQVDVVQSVGRVMRKDPGKQYGYVILPIGIPSGLTPEEALADNQKYKVVWQVLQALRAHDERFNAMVNKIELNRAKDDKLQIIGVGGFGDDRDPASLGKAESVQTAFAFPELADWREAIYAKIVQKVGSRRYWEDWAKDVKNIADTNVTRIKALLADPDIPVQAEFDDFLAGLRGNLNDSISRDDAIDMLAQHLITRPVFDALFDGYSFTEHNPVSQVMQHMLDALDEYNLVAENETLDDFYASVRMRAEGIDNAEGKQRIITELYEKFFKIAFPRAAESLGIVYTPVEVVDFILRSVEHVLNTEFDASISDPGVHVLDPFTGTGTFVVRLLQSGLIKPQDLLRKYTEELHANELLLLAYYIAAINIEATFHGITGQPYTPFNGIVLTDTFQMTEDGDTMDEVIFPANNERVTHQKALDIRVIVGNPPYSAGQVSANDNNANLKYPSLDASIAKTYGHRSAGTSAASKTSLRDSYIRAIRWASDRVLPSDHGGIVAFVTNGGYIDSNSADGLRKVLAAEFHEIFIFNLRGNTRTTGETARMEGGQIFGPASRATVAVMLLVKKPGATAGAQIRYRDIGDYQSRDQKLAIVAESTIDHMDWQTIVANDSGDWINQRSGAYEAFTPIGMKVAKGASSPQTLFTLHTRGLETSRDAWAYNFNRSVVLTNMERMVAFYDEQVDDLNDWCYQNQVTNRRSVVDDFINLDPHLVSWSGTLKNFLARGLRAEFEPARLTTAMYRPFCRQVLYFDQMMNHARGLTVQAFPTPAHENVGIYLTGPSSHYEFSALMTDRLPDLHLLDTGQFFPRYTYERVDGDADLFAGELISGYRRVDNITDRVLVAYRRLYGDAVSKDDIFFYTYGMLMSEQYRRDFAADLHRMLPRVPNVASPKEFRLVVEAGRALGNLHVGYELVTPYPLRENWSPSKGRADSLRVQKMRYAKSGGSEDRSVIVVNGELTLEGVPAEVSVAM